MAIVTGTGLKLTDDHGTTVVTAETDRHVILLENKATPAVDTVILTGDTGDGKGNITVQGTVNIKAGSRTITLAAEPMAPPSSHTALGHSPGVAGPVGIFSPNLAADIRIDASNSSFVAGGWARAGQLILNKSCQQIVKLDAEDATLTLGDHGINGKVSVHCKDGNPAAELLAFDNEAVIEAGTTNRPGRLTMYNAAGQNTVNLTTKDAALTLGDYGVNGKVSVHCKDGNPAAELLAFDNEAVIGAGTTNRPGRLTMYNAAGQNTVNLTTSDSTLALGGGGSNGRVSVFGKDGQPLVELLGGDGESVIGVGQIGRPGRISLYGADHTEKIRLDANVHKLSVGSVLLDGVAGDVILQNADCAEDFDVASIAGVEPGTVMALNDSGQLDQARKSYDTRVAGVVSGAGDFKPGLVLDRQANHGNRLPIALVGKVFCKVDASYSRIKVGDLLTTSDTPGHAMKATDHEKSFGTIIGKALRPLESGRGLVPILVALQ